MMKSSQLSSHKLVRCFKQNRRRRLPLSQNLCLRALLRRRASLTSGGFQRHASIVNKKPCSSVSSRSNKNGRSSTSQTCHCSLGSPTRRFTSGTTTARSSRLSESKTTCIEASLTVHTLHTPFGEFPFC